MTETRTPSPELAGQYEVVGVEPGEVQTVTHGRVDLRTIDLATAAALVATGQFPYLVATAQPAPATEPEPAPAAPAAEGPVEKKGTRRTPAAK